MNAPEALHCAGCGSELGLEPVAERGGGDCPSCRSPLSTFLDKGGRLYDCQKCGGQFVEPGLLRHLLSLRHSLASAAVGLPPRCNPLAQPVRYLGCPGCGELMNRRNFGGRSGIIVDTCQRHGVWFDAGELPRVLAFVAQGGLTLPAGHPGAGCVDHSVVDPRHRPAAAADRARSPLAGASSGQTPGPASEAPLRRAWLELLELLERLWP